jgi:hypothetical protein
VARKTKPGWELLSWADGNFTCMIWGIESVSHRWNLLHRMWNLSCGEPANRNIAKISVKIII